MARLIQWLAEQIDGRLSVAGAVYVLVLITSGIGGVIALTTDQTLFALALLIAFVFLLSLLLFTALRTDPSLKMTTEERAAAWAKAPVFLKVSLYLLVGGQLAQVLLQQAGAYHHYEVFGLAGIAASSFVFGRGVAVHRPPLPRVGAEPLTPESAPVEYKRLVASIKAVSLFIAASFSALALWTIFR